MVQEKLFSEDKWEVENAADILTKARELEKTKPAIYVAALKLLKRRQVVIGAILKSRKS